MEKIYLVFSIISQQDYFLGAFRSIEKAEEFCEYRASLDSSQDYRRVDPTLWYGKTHKIEIRPVTVD